MLERVIDEMRANVGFNQRDITHLAGLADDARPVIQLVVRSFYDRLLDQPGARQIFTGGPEQIRHLEGLLAAWLQGLFAGHYDHTYFAGIARIGSRHVEVGLPQRYMLLGIELVWQELAAGLTQGGRRRLDNELASLHKLLTLNLAVMLESYKSGYSDQTRRSERAAMEAKLTRAEHLAEIGQLAASLAHEIKNPLAGISGAIQIIGDALPASNPHRPIIRDILRQINRLDATVKDLLLYARPTPPTLHRTRLDELVARVMTLLDREPAVQRVRVERDGSVPASFIHADEGQLEQVLVNLILNAAHASPDAAPVRIHVTQREATTELSVSDVGSGMPPEVRERALEPFFTTKAQGTGLGLTICRHIVEAHDGRIRIDSHVGKGTTVTIELPRAEAPNAGQGG